MTKKMDTEKKKTTEKKKAPEGAENKETSKTSQKKAYPSGKGSLEKKFNEECVPALLEKFKYANKSQVPSLKKIVINTSLKEAVTDSKILTGVAEDISSICGQKAMITKAKKSIANFKIREGMPIGCSVTLRRRRMYEFLNRFVNVALPRVKDFRGVSPKGFDGRGNYTLGLTEHTIFPEINFDKVQRVYGMNITFVTSAPTDDEGKELLSVMGMPFRKL
ncbi:MAG: 50S ribosomal protein L5 [Pseudomonadota bacterium]